MTIEKTLPLMILATIALSALLLGMGQGDYEPLFVAVIGASAAFMVVDRLKWFQLPQWLANLLAILVTVVTVSNFYFTTDSVRHLLGVGKLLVYLQTILLFQRKSSRVYWQVLVLSLLQIVVGAVFNLGFEGGVLFIVYMMVIGVTMMMLHLYQDRQINRVRNEEYGEFADKARISKLERPIALSTNFTMPRGVLRRMVGSFGIFAVGALFFSILLFYFLPRDNSSWSGPEEKPMNVTGFNKKVDMGHSEIILLSTRLAMNVRYWYPGKEMPFKPISEPYLRGIALSNIKVQDNKTRWIPPPYQIYDADFRALRSIRSEPNWVVQEIVLEPTDDPLLYSAIPPRVGFDHELAGEFEWCWPLAGLTRQRASEKITLASYRYDLQIPILSTGEFHSAWPYSSRGGRNPLTKESDPGTFKWMTYLDPDRYPTIVSEGERLRKQTAGQSQSVNHYSLANAMETLFLTDQFRYTLDFRNLDRDETIDPVEDFFANFRAGHCEYYASALALMLRSQEIPARLVVGYRGGDVNDFGGHLDVESRHAHVWVEAYVRPEDCPEHLFTTRQASRSMGAWVRLDPTPAIDLDSLTSNNDDALDFAKSLWRDYVLGLQSETQSRMMSSGGLRMRGLLKLLDLAWWQQSFEGVVDKLKEPGGWRTFLVPLFVIISTLLAAWFFISQKRLKQKVRVDGQESPPEKASWLRRKFAGVLSLVSPTLGEWMAGSSIEQHGIVPFYERMINSLKRAGYQRSPSQTPREFALQVATDLSIKARDEPIQSSHSREDLAATITDFYYRVRYGNVNLTSEQTQQIEKALTELELRLQVR